MSISTFGLGITQILYDTYCVILEDDAGHLVLVLGRMTHVLTPSVIFGAQVKMGART